MLSLHTASLCSYQTFSKRGKVLFLHAQFQQYHTVWCTSHSTVPFTGKFQFPYRYWSMVHPLGGFVDGFKGMVRHFHYCHFAAPPPHENENFHEFGVQFSLTGLKTLPGGLVLAPQRDDKALSSLLSFCCPATL